MRRAHEHTMRAAFCRWRTQHFLHRRACRLAWICHAWQKQALAQAWRKLQSARMASIHSEALRLGEQLALKVEAMQSEKLENQHAMRATALRRWLKHRRLHFLRSSFARIAAESARQARCNERDLRNSICLEHFVKAPKARCLASHWVAWRLAHRQARFYRVLAACAIDIDKKIDSVRQIRALYRWKVALLEYKRDADYLMRELTVDDMREIRRKAQHHLLRLDVSRRSHTKFDR